MADVKFIKGDPPSPRSNQEAARIVQALAAKPGVWAEVGRFSQRSRADSLRGRIAAHPGVEVVARKDAETGEGVVYARWVVES